MKVLRHSLHRGALLIGLISPSPFLCHAGDFSLRGYLKSYVLVQEGVEIRNAVDDLDNTRTQSLNSIRLMGAYFSDQRGNFELHYELQPIYYSDEPVENDLNSINSTVVVGASPYRYSDPPAVLKSYNDKTLILQNLDRMNYQYSSEYGDLTIGRQVVSFGSARFINPTDIFLPFVIQTLNQEYRVGIDALRYQADLGDFAVLDGGVVLGEKGKKENRALFLRGKNSLSGNDVEGIFIKTNQSWLLGGGIERALGDLGFWFESAYARFDNADNYWRTSTGVDYAFGDKIITMVEYHYNGAGSDDPDHYAELLSQAAFQKGGVYLFGEQYLIPALTWTVTPLFYLSASGFFNLSDNSIFLNIAAELSWSDNLYSDFGSFITFGESFELEQNPQRLSFGSEFGAYPLSVYSSMRYYF